MTKEEFLAWKADPVTQDFYKLLRAFQQGLMEQWSSGAFNDDNPSVTHAANVSAVGEGRAYEKLIELDFEQIEEALNDE
jgi:hypothetical protein